MRVASFLPVATALADLPPSYARSRVDRRLNQLGGFWAEEFGVPDVSEDREAGLREIFKEVMAVERDGVSCVPSSPWPSTALVR